MPEHLARSTDRFSGSIAAAPVACAGASFIQERGNESIDLSRPRARRVPAELLENVLFSKWNGRL